MAYYLHLINSHKHCLSSHLLKLLVESLVFSHLSYALPVWGPPLNQQLLQRLERTQNRAVRLCKNLSKFDYISEHYWSLSWLPLQQLIQFRSAGMMYHQYHHSRGISLSPSIKLDIVSHHMTLEWLIISRIRRGFTLVFHIDFFDLRHPIGRTLYHPHLSEIRTFMPFVRTIMIIYWLMCSVCLAMCFL